MLFQVRYATCSFNLAHSTTPLGPFLVLPSWPGRLSKVVHSLRSDAWWNTINPSTYQCRTPVENSNSGKEDYNIFSSYTTLANRPLFLLISSHRNSNNLNNKISLFRLPSLKILSLNISKSSDPTFPRAKPQSFKTPPPLSTTAVWPCSSIAFNCIAPQGHPRVDLSVPRNLSL